MAKRKESNRTGWSRGSSNTTSSRPAVSRASGSNSSDARPAADASLKRMGPYETSYQIDFGYSNRDNA